ncbi:uncharacterized protein G2W53_007999 [Senna tora]|uniref:Uncharacterized protein n=1 Tax=Senna tora TaxID=362788 RepID=A0A834X7Y6_9FABA|nr:uncharacterized protein G2W53_007999 [Senna tora]
MLMWVWVWENGFGLGFGGGFGWNPAKWWPDLVCRGETYLVRHGRLIYLCCSESYIVRLGDHFGQTQVPPFNMLPFRVPCKIRHAFLGSREDSGSWFGGASQTIVLSTSPSPSSSLVPPTFFPLLRAIEFTSEHGVSSIFCSRSTVALSFRSVVLAGLLCNLHLISLRYPTLGFLLSLLATTIAKDSSLQGEDVLWDSGRTSTSLASTTYQEPLTEEDNNELIRQSVVGAIFQQDLQKILVLIKGLMVKLRDACYFPSGDYGPTRWKILIEEGSS